MCPHSDEASTVMTAATTEPDLQLTNLLDDVALVGLSWILQGSFLLLKSFSGGVGRGESSHRLTEHGVKLLRVEVPLSPRRLVTLRLGIVGVVKLRLRAKGVQDP